MRGRLLGPSLASFGQAQPVPGWGWWECRRLQAALCLCRHARKHFSQAEGSQLDEVRQVMGMLAFPPDTHISPYKVRCAPGLGWGRACRHCH